MLERRASFAHLFHTPNSVGRLSRPRPGVKCSAIKQKTTLNLYRPAMPSPVCGLFRQSSFKGEKQYHTRVKHLLLKHSKLGFIKNFSNLNLSPDLNRTSASDDFVTTPTLDDNFTYSAEISSKIIEKEEFELGRVLGSGGFGSVYEGTFRNKKVAIKMMHKFTKNPAAQRESFMAEFHVMRFEHPNIVKTLAATHIDKFDEGAWVVMEYISTSTLNAVLNDPNEELDSKRRVKYSFQIASAIHYAHKNRIAHLDLKPANILITEEGDYKILTYIGADFGCSQKVEFDVGVISPTNRSSLTGTIAYRAPELLRGEAPTFKADIYSFAITLWQLKSREPPYLNQNQHVVIFGVVANGLRPMDPDPEETDAFELSNKDLYKQCWHGVPRERPSARELMDLLSVWKEHL